MCSSTWCRLGRTSNNTSPVGPSPFTQREVAPNTSSSPCPPSRNPHVWSDRKHASTQTTFSACRFSFVLAGPRRHGCLAGPRRHGCLAGPRRHGCLAGPRRDGCLAGPRRDGCLAGPHRDGYLASPHRDGCLNLFRSYGVDLVAVDVKAFSQLSTAHVVVETADPQALVTSNVTRFTRNTSSTRTWRGW
jgi:hypothetical protein